MELQTFLNTKCLSELKEKIKWTLLGGYFWWFLVKIKIIFPKKYNQKFPKEWEIWNCYLWQNIWSEQWWWDKMWFSRPVLILKTFWFVNDNILVFPLTKQSKPDYISFILKKEECDFLKFDKSYVLLDQVRTISKKRLIWKTIWTISGDDLSKIISKFLLFFNKKKDLNKNPFRPTKGISEDLK